MSDTFNIIFQDITATYTCDDEFNKDLSQVSIKEIRNDTDDNDIYKNVKDSFQEESSLVNSIDDASKPDKMFSFLNKSDLEQESEAEDENLTNFETTSSKALIEKPLTKKGKKAMEKEIRNDTINRDIYENVKDSFQEDSSSVNSIDDASKPDKMFSFLNESDIEQESKTVDENLTNFETTSSKNLIEKPLTKKVKKAMEKEKLQLYSESQRLIRETQLVEFNYNPPRYKKFDDFLRAFKTDRKENKEPLPDSLQVEDPQTLSDTPNDLTTENAEEVYDEIRPLRERLEQSMGPLPESLLPARKSETPKMSGIARFLQEKYKDVSSIDLLTYHKDNKKALSDLTQRFLFNKQRKTANIPGIEKQTISLLIKKKDETTGQENFTVENIVVEPEVKKKLVIVAGTVDPIMSKGCEEELLTMSKKDRWTVHRRLLLDGAHAKSKQMRLDRVSKEIADGINQEEVDVTQQRRVNDDGLDDDDYEWKEDQVESDSEEDSDADERRQNSSADKETDVEEDESENETDSLSQKEEDDDDDDDFIGHRKMRKTLRSHVISDDEEENEPVKLRLHDFRRLPDKQRLRCQRSPLIESKPELENVELPGDIVELIGELKRRYGLDKLDGAEMSSMLLLPTMKTSVVCVENQLKEQILSSGMCNAETIDQYRRMVDDNSPIQMVTKWTDDFNFITSEYKSDQAKGMYSFVRNSFEADESTNIFDGTVVIGNSSEPLNDQSIQPNDQIGTQTEFFDSAYINSLHGKLFEFGDPDAVVNDSMKTVLLHSTASDEKIDSPISNVNDSKIDNHVSIANDKDTDKFLSDEECRDIDDVDLDDEENDRLVISEKNIDKTEALYEESDESGSEKNRDDDERIESESEDSVSEESEKDEELSDGVVSNEDDEEEILRQSYTGKQKSVFKDYFEDEAEFSGSDAEKFGSDEDENGLDEYEEEEGDKEVLPSAEDLRKGIERYYWRQEKDEDANKVKILQEMLFGDEDYLGDGKRNRRSYWDFNDDGQNKENVKIGGFGEDEQNVDNDFDNYQPDMGDIDIEDKKINDQNDNLLKEYGKMLRQGSLRKTDSFSRKNGPSTSGLLAAHQRGSFLNKIVTLDVGSGESMEKMTENFTLKTKMAQHTFSIKKRQLDSCDGAAGFVKKSKMS